MATRTDPASRILRLIERLEPRIRRQFLLAVLNTANTFTLDEIVELLENNQLLVALADITETEAGNLASTINAGFLGAGENTAEFLTRAIGVTVAFDQANTRAVETMQQNRLRLVTGFTQEQVEATRTALIDGIQRGLNPREQARNFRASIGLTQRQVQAVQNYRNLLETGSREALNRQLRDRRFDGTVERAIETDTPLTETQINRMTERYRERYLRFRSETIARTEALRSVHEGAEEGYAQAIGQGRLDIEDIQRRWVTALDERVRGSHRDLHGQTKGFGETFQGDDGELRFPGDPDAPASETVNCRCILTARIQVE